VCGSREITDKRTSGEDVKQIIAKLNPVLRGWGNYFRSKTTGVPENGQLRLWATRSVDVSPRRAASDAASSMDSPTVSRNGSVSIARNRALPGASRISKIIVKPCAGKPHARFERGLLKTGWLL
jgi:RNA-directed DNA polymerase